MRRRSLVIYDRTLSGVLAHQVEYPGGGGIGAVEGNNLARFRWAADPYVVREASEWRTSAPRWAVAATRGEEMDGFCWLEADIAEVTFLDLESPLPRGSVYLSRVWVCPEMRGQGIGRYLVTCATALAAQLGSERILSAAVPHNARMHRLFAELGWACRRTVAYRRVGPLMAFSARTADGRRSRAWSIQGGSSLFAHV
jgi:GNAT superfamily N-acetyltransferase